ncbi:MAG: hypothetical protein ABJF11_03335 [Reichenbachiella sp.]|uniref:hypothetical protein n=1 Tax=Reichenbachiella sp. TaxID=2184521 RepID=UPI0032670241
MNKVIVIGLIVAFIVSGFFLLVGSRIAEREYQMYFSKIKYPDSIAGTIDPERKAWLDSLIHFENRMDSLSLVLEDCMSEIAPIARD